MRITKTRALCTQEMRITRTRCVVHSRGTDHKEEVSSALKSSLSQGHGALCTQELQITRSRCAVQSRAADHKDTVRCALELRLTGTRCVVHSRATYHKDTVWSAFKSWGSHEYDA
ncbi:hypothetical protein NDU88_006120 [Pleurodeles waltl]|uniref:Uncharacterized protein n=1 Tax=Pleurodeles waltl TaxID=8319 RepID=A0AAV7L2T3_PLEWA|nr:hypothetical protein NDU88_006120 [Pleurodeles waltl]